MIDRAMIARLLAQIGTPDATVTEKGMEFARAIYTAGMEDERSKCAELIEAYPEWIGDNAKREIAQAIRMRANAIAQGREHSERTAEAEG